MSDNSSRLASTIALAVSQCFLASTALVLLSGGTAILAGALSGSAVLLLEEFSGSGCCRKEVDKWLCLSLFSAETSTGLWLFLHLCTVLGADDSESMNLSANIFYRGMGLVILGMLVRDVRENPSKETKIEGTKSSLSWTMCRIDIEILQGRDLVAKDKNIFGKYVSSDPYVKVRHGNAIVGQTRIAPKTLNPKWNSEIFSLCMPHEAFEKHDSVDCCIYDHDHLSKDDPMGVVTVPLTWSKYSSKLEWYPVMKGSRDEFCADARGEVLVKITYSEPLNGF
jgi:hypothetical protein